MSDGSEASIFLSYDGIVGEVDLSPEGVSPGPGKNWIPLSRCSLAAAVNVQGRAMSGGGTTKVDFGGDAPPLTIVKRTDGATVGLMREMLGSAALKTATITFVRTDGDGPSEYLRYDLVGCSVVEFDFLSSGQDRADETFKILYRQLIILGYAGTHGSKGAQSMAVLSNGA
jgi:type VI protein secretion system component Hcp